MTKAELTAGNGPAWEPRQWAMNGTRGTHENQGGVEVFIAPMHVLGVILRHLLFVRGVEIELGHWSRWVGSTFTGLVRYYDGVESATVDPAHL